MHLSVIVQQGQHQRPPSAPALPVAKFIFVRKSTKNPPISTASCPFFPLQALPASSQHAESADAPRCITHRTALHRPPHRTPPNTAPLPAACLTPPSTPFHHPAAFSPTPRRTLPSAPPHMPHGISREFEACFAPISHRVRIIYIMCRKQNCTFLKKKGHNALPICQIALPLQTKNGNKGCQARQNTPGSTLDA